VQEVVSKSTKGWRQATERAVMELLPQDLCLQSIRMWNGGGYGLFLAKSYLAHCGVQFAYKLNPGCPSILSVSGSKSRFSNSNQKAQKGYTSYIQFGELTWDTVCYCTCKSGTIGGCAHVVAQLMFLYHQNAGEDLPPLVLQSRASANDIINISDFASARRAFKRTVKQLPNEDDGVLVYVCYIEISISHHVAQIGLTNDSSHEIVMSYDATQWQVQGDGWVLRSNWRDSCSYLNCDELPLVDDPSPEDDISMASVTNNNTNSISNNNTQPVRVPPVYIHRVTTRKKDNSHVFRNFL